MGDEDRRHVRSLNKIVVLLVGLAEGDAVATATSLSSDIYRVLCATPSAQASATSTLSYTPREDKLSVAENGKSGDRGKCVRSSIYGLSLITQLLEGALLAGSTNGSGHQRDESMRVLIIPSDKGLLRITSPNY